MLWYLWKVHPAWHYQRLHWWYQSCQMPEACITRACQILGSRSPSRSQVGFVLRVQKNWVLWYLVATTCCRKDGDARWMDCLLDESGWNLASSRGNLQKESASAARISRASYKYNHHWNRVHFHHPGESTICHRPLIYYGRYLFKRVGGWEVISEKLQTERKKLFCFTFGPPNKYRLLLGENTNCNTCPRIVHLGAKFGSHLAWKRQLDATLCPCWCQIYSLRRRQEAKLCAGKYSSQGTRWGIVLDGPPSKQQTFIFLPLCS